MEAPETYLVARCLSGCGMTEAFDVERLAFCQRTLPPSAIAAKLRAPADPGR